VCTSDACIRCRDVTTVHRCASAGCFFFFQAEDGIRDLIVTGVQTCALPISPIPRSLAMSFFGDLDVSVIDELPPGRVPIITKLVSNSRRQEVFERIQDTCRSGQQVYWVCPLIEESETLQLETAIQTH